VLAGRGLFGYDTPVAGLWPEFGAHGKDVTGPLGVGDELYFGMPPSEHGRLARLEDAESTAEMASSISGSASGDLPDLPMFKAGPRALFPTAQLGNRTDILTADIPAGAKTSARAIARIYAALLGEVDGVRLIQPERLHDVTAVAASGTDEIFGNQSSWGLGYAIGLPGCSAADTPSVFGMAGAGGSYAYGDTAIGTAFALTKNRVTMDFGTVSQVIGIVTAAFS
jgi:CubicO group peptidase (beta-lactamase class C family)